MLWLLTHHCIVFGHMLGTSYSINYSESDWTDTTGLEWEIFAGWMANNSRSMVLCQGRSERWRETALNHSDAWGFISGPTGCLWFCSVCCRCLVWLSWIWRSMPNITRTFEDLPVSVRKLSAGVCSCERTCNLFVSRFLMWTDLQFLFVSQLVLNCLLKITSKRSSVSEDKLRVSKCTHFISAPM